MDITLSLILSETILPLILLALLFLVVVIGSFLEIFGLWPDQNNPDNGKEFQ